MTRRDPGLEPELEAFLRRRRIEPVLPAPARARVLAHARTIIARGTAVSSSPRTEPLTSAPFSVGRRRLPARGCPAGVTGVRGRRHHNGRRASGRTAPPAAAGPAAALRDDPIVPAPGMLDPPAQASELSLNQQVTPPADATCRSRAGSFRRGAGDPSASPGGLCPARPPNALVALAEHARRFPDGRLAEEREALRVRSLLALGRRHKARKRPRRRSPPISPQCSLAAGRE